MVNMMELGSLLLAYALPQTLAAPALYVHGLNLRWCHQLMQPDQPTRKFYARKDISAYDKPNFYKTQ